MSERKKEEIGIGEAGEMPAGITPLATKKPEPPGEVEGHYRRTHYVMCPHCYFLNEPLEETESRMWFTCCYCEKPFLY